MYQTTDYTVQKTPNPIRKGRTHIRGRSIRRDASDTWSISLTAPRQAHYLLPSPTCPPQQPTRPLSPLKRQTLLHIPFPLRTNFTDQHNSERTRLISRTKPFLPFPNTQPTHDPRPKATHAKPKRRVCTARQLPFPASTTLLQLFKQPTPTQKKNRVLQTARPAGHLRRAARQASSGLGYRLPPCRERERERKEKEKKVSRPRLFFALDAQSLFSRARAGKWNLNFRALWGD